MLLIKWDRIRPQQEVDLEKNLSPVRPNWISEKFAYERQNALIEDAKINLVLSLVKNPPYSSLILSPNHDVNQHVNQQPDLVFRDRKDTHLAP